MKRIILLSLLATAMVSGVVYLEMTEDKTPPVITFPKEEKPYNYNDETADLMQGVTAYDQEDGDVSKNIKIDRIVPILSKEQVAVVYLVRDGKNNYVREQRILQMDEETLAYYTEDQSLTKEEEKEEIKKDTIENSETENEESVEGEVKDEASELVEGTILTPTPYPEGTPVIRLLETEIELAVGSAFNFQNYYDVNSISDDKDNPFDLAKRISLQGKVDTSQPGTYQVRYVVYDSDGNISNEDAVLTVHVK